MFHQGYREEEIGGFQFAASPAHLGRIAKTENADYGGTTSRAPGSVEYEQWARMTQHLELIGLFGQTVEEDKQWKGYLRPQTPDPKRLHG